MCRYSAVSVKATYKVHRKKNHHSTFPCFWNASIGCPTEAELISVLYNSERLTFNKPKLSLMSSSQSLLVVSQSNTLNYGYREHFKYVLLNSVTHYPIILEWYAIVLYRHFIRLSENKSLTKYSD
jgi:hypothetical protein